MRTHGWVALIGMALLHPALAAEPGWTADKNGCRVWNSTPKPGESVSWSGPCKDGLVDGYGVLVWLVDGQLEEAYVGVLSNGHYTGYGTQVWRTGASFTGSYLNDQASGWGSYRDPAGNEVSGDWVGGCIKQGTQRSAVGVPLRECP